jgi:hypothetical protein
MQTKGYDEMPWLLSVRGDAVVQASVADILDTCGFKADIHQKIDDAQFPIHRSLFRAQRKDFFETVPLLSSNSRTSFGTRDDPYVLNDVTPLDFSTLLAVFFTP